MTRLLSLYGTAVERIVGVYAYTFLGLLLADRHGVNISSAHAAAVAAAPAALMAVQALVARAAGINASPPPAAAETLAPQDDLTP